MFQKTLAKLAYLTFLLAVVCLADPTPVAAQDNGGWTRFRGPNGSGVSKDIGLPNKWSDSQYKWKVKLAGSGTSSPVVWHDKVFVTSCDAKSGKVTIECLHLDSGKQLWSRTFDLEVHKQHRLNSYASGTPAVDSKHVYFLMADPSQTLLIALDHEGNDSWKRDFGSWQSQHGFGASPTVYKDKVIFANSQQAQRLKAGATPGKSRMVAVLAADGSDAWETPLTATRACYAVPCILKSKGKPDQLIGANTGDGFCSFDPQTGKLNWSTQLIRRRTVASPVVANGMIFASSGSGGGGNELVAIAPFEDQRQNKDAAEIPSRYVLGKAACYVPTAIVVGDLLYMCGDKGVFSCIEAKSGEVKYQQRLGRGFSSSPVATGDRIFATDQEGNVYVVKAGAKFELLGKSGLGEPCSATPAITTDSILFRTDSHLMLLEAS